MCIYIYSCLCSDSYVYACTRVHMHVCLQLTRWAERSDSVDVFRGDPASLLSCTLHLSKDSSRCGFHPWSSARVVLGRGGGGGLTQIL